MGGLLLFFLTLTGVLGGRSSDQKVRVPVPTAAEIEGVLEQAGNDVCYFLRESRRGVGVSGAENVSFAVEGGVVLLVPLCLLNEGQPCFPKNVKVNVGRRFSAEYLNFVYESLSLHRRLGGRGNLTGALLQPEAEGKKKKLRDKEEELLFRIRALRCASGVCLDYNHCARGPRDPAPFPYGNLIQDLQILSKNKSKEAKENRAQVCRATPTLLFPLALIQYRYRC
jgi:hypothetical protein